MYDCVIIGAGMAGLTAAIYLRRASKSVLVLEGASYGGQIINTLKIANYPGFTAISGPDLMRATYEQAVALGAEVEFSQVLAVEPFEKGGFKITTEEEEIKGRTVILASGTEDRKLGLPLEKELVSHGVSYCATCDGAFFKGKEVVVNGGGNTALYDTLYLADLCSRVYLVHRRAEFRGDPALVEKIQALPNVEIITPATIGELFEVDGVLTGVRLNLGEGGTRELPVSGLFVAIGRVPATGLVSELVELNEQGYVLADESCKTSVPGVFAAGDVRAKLVRQLVTASADGAVAARGVLEYLK